ncbi:MAG: hypothetical protein KDB53_14900, partial [Planctomycetes bacterium]|nr:hypothetical protein [Planctomycetota bacterium]
VDEQSLRFRIREAAVWDDGSFVTADDFVRTWRTMRDEGSTLGSAEASIAGVASIERASLRELVVRCSAPVPAVLDAFGRGFVVLHPSFDTGDASAENPDLCGPCDLDGRDARDETELLLIRKVDWWGDRVPELKGHFAFDRYRFHFVTDQATEVRMLESGQIDLCAVPAARADRLKEQGLEVASYYLSSYSILGFNATRAPFDRAEARRALARLLPRHAMVDADFKGLVRPVDGPFGEGLEAEDASSTIARSELAKAGYTDTDGDGRVDRAGAPLEITVLVPAGGIPWLEAVTTRLVDAANAAGVALRFEARPVSALLAALSAKDFDAFLIIWNARELAPSFRELLHSTEIRDGGRNFMGYRSDEADRITDALVRVTDPNQRRALQHELQALIVRERPVAFLFQHASLAAWNPARVAPVFSPRGLSWADLAPPAR